MTWRPAHEAHAIERATLTLAFQDGVPAKALHGAVEGATAELLSQGFAPFAAPTAGNIIIIGGPNATLHEDGRGFRLIRGGELIEEVVFDRTLISYTTTRYTRWKQVTSRISALIGQVADRMIDLSNISALKLEYYDRFVFQGRRENANYPAAIKYNSPFVPSFYQTKHELWHSHVGYFNVVGYGYQRLVNANVDVLDVLPNLRTPDIAAEPRRSIGVYTMAEDRFFTGDLAQAPQKVSTLFLVADEMHDALKNVLREVISPALADSISLDTKGA